MRADARSVGRLIKAALPVAGSVALTPLLLFISTTNTLFIKNAVDFSNDVHVLTQFFVYFYRTFVLGLFLFLLTRFLKLRLLSFPFWLYILAGPFFLVYAFLHVRVPAVMDRLLVCGTFAAVYFIAAGLLTWKGKVDTAVSVASRGFLVFFLVEALILAANGESRRISSKDRSELPPLKEAQSRRPNIYHILFDAYQTDLFEHTLTSDVRSQLAGYQFFRENITAYASTLMSVPSVFLGRLYSPDTPQKAYAYEAFNSEGSFLRSLIEHGYDTSAFLSVSLCEGAMRLFQHVRSHGEYADIKFTVDSSGEFKNLWLYAHFPAFVVRKLIAEKSIEDLKGGQVLPESQPIYSHASFQRFLREEESLPDHNRYTFLHIMVPHPPFVLRADGSFGPPREDGSLPKTSMLPQAQCATNMIVQFTNVLNKLGRFNDSMIVIHADHGTWGLPAEVMSKNYTRSNDYTTEGFAWAVSRALLLLKLPGRGALSPFRVSNAETSLLDILPTMLDAVGIQPDVTYQGISLVRAENVPNNREREFNSYKGASFGQRQLAESFVRFIVRGKRYTKEGRVELTADNARGFLGPEELRYFNGDESVSDIQYGGFEEFPAGAKYPTGWGGLLEAPRCDREDKRVKFGKFSLKLTSAPGESNKSRRIRTLTAPPIEELRGKELSFGMWVYTSQPEKVKIQIIDSWKRYFDARPGKPNEWQLVTKRAVISQDAEHVQLALTLVDGGESPIECYVDGAALVIHE